MIDAAFIEACAPSVAVETVQAIVRNESAGDPLALNANRPEGPTRLRPNDLAEAVLLARRELQAGHSVDVGLMQINSDNFERLGVSLEAVFNPCTNLRAGAAILTHAYDAAQKHIPEPQAALQAALSAYNTGSFSRGFENGYVARYYAAQQAATPRLTSISYDPYTADTAVYVRPQEEAMNTDATAAHSADAEPKQKPITSRNYGDLLTPGVQVELDPADAEALGITQEDALSAEDAWESNGDPSTFEAAQR